MLLAMAASKKLRGGYINLAFNSEGKDARGVAYTSPFFATDDEPWVVRETRNGKVRVLSWWCEANVCRKLSLLQHFPLRNHKKMNSGTARLLASFRPPTLVFSLFFFTFRLFTMHACILTFSPRFFHPPDVHLWYRAFSLEIIHEFALKREEEKQVG